MRVVHLHESGVLAVDFGPHSIRLVTHRDISREDILDALARSRRLLAGVA